MNRMNRVGETVGFLKISVMILKKHIWRQCFLPMPGLLLDAMEGDFAVREPKCIHNQQYWWVREDILGTVQEGCVEIWTFGQDVYQRGEASKFCHLYHRSTVTLGFRPGRSFRQFGLALWFGDLRLLCLEWLRDCEL